MLDGGANVCAIGGADQDIVYGSEKLRQSIAVEGVHGTPTESKVKLDAKGSICLLGVMVKVYISEHLDTNIVSDGVLTRLGFEVMKSKSKVSVKPPNSTTWCDLAIDPDGRAYFREKDIQRPSPSSVCVLREKECSLVLWHARLGHRGYDYLDAMRKFPQYVRAGFNFKPGTSKPACEDCIRAKFNKSHFHPPRQRPKEIGVLWYTDVAGGGQRTPSLVNGSKYRTIYVEATTQLKISLFESTKDNHATVRGVDFFISRVMPLFLKGETKSSAVHLVYMNSDNGEMASKAVQKRLAAAGIVSRFTCPYTPEQNGMAERANRYIDEAACTMLAAARLPEAFWEEASRHATLLTNIVPWKRNGELTVDSYSRLHRKPFPFHLLRVFGCKAFVFDKAQDSSNLVPRSLQGIYCGFAQDQITEQGWAYRIFVPSQNRFIHSGQVKFFEDIDRGPEMLLPPSFLADLESEEFDVDKYHRKMVGQIHIDHEDGIFYTVKRVFAKEGMALVERLPWPETKDSRLELVHLRDVLRMQLKDATDMEGRISGSLLGDALPTMPGGDAREVAGTPALSDPKQARGQRPEVTANHSISREGLPGKTDSQAGIRSRDGGLSEDPNAKRRKTVSERAPSVSEPATASTNGGDDPAQPRRRSSRLRDMHIPRAHLLSRERFEEAQAQRIIDWSLSKNTSLSPHLITPEIFSLSADEEPSSHSEVERHPKREEWILGEIKERDSVNEAECLKIINRSEVPPGRKILRLRWVYKVKRNDKGEAVLYKCRIVVMGNEATEGVDYFETFAPVCKIASLRLVIALIIHFGLKPCQVDVHTAYLHAPIDEDIYVTEMPGYPLPPGKVFKLLKSLYGLPQAGKNWNDLLDAFLKSLGFQPLLEDPCIYVLVEGGRIVSIFAVYVDDFVIGSDSTRREIWILEELRKKFKIKELGTPKLILGITLDWVPSSSSNRFYDHVYLTIPKSVQALLDLLPGGADLKARTTPGNVAVTLTKDMMMTEDEKDSQADDMQSMYRSAVGLCIWIQQTVRYDISYSTHRLASFVSNPGYQHFKALLWLAGYLKSTMLRGIKYSHGGVLELHGYVDANHLNDPDDRLSTWSYVFTMNGAPFSWKVGKTKRVCVGGTMESEVRAVDAMKRGIQEVLYLKKVFHSLSLSNHIMNTLIGLDPRFPVKISEDNNACIQMSARPISHSSVKYLEADIHWIHSHISDGSIVLVYIPSPYNLANIGTKYLGSADFKREVLMSMSDGAYELVSPRDVEGSSPEVRMAVLRRFDGSHWLGEGF